MSYGCCDQCNKRFSFNDEIISLVEMKDKVLDLQFCNNECLYISKKKFPFLKGFSYENHEITSGQNRESIENVNQIIVDLFQNHPQHLIKNYDDYVNKENVQPIILNGIELLDRILDYGDHDFMDDHVKDFLQDCLSYNLF